MKNDGAPELKELRRLVSAKRSQPTFPLDVPVRESKGNGAVEKAVRTWQGQFRTLRSHLESEIGYAPSIDKATAISGYSSNNPNSYTQLYRITLPGQSFST